MFSKFASPHSCSVAVPCLRWAWEDGESIASSRNSRICSLGLIALWFHLTFIGNKWTSLSLVCLMAAASPALTEITCPRELRADRGSKKQTGSSRNSNSKLLGPEKVTGDPEIRQSARWSLASPTLTNDGLRPIDKLYWNDHVFLWNVFWMFFSIKSNSIFEIESETTWFVYSNLNVTFLEIITDLKLNWR